MKTIQFACAIYTKDGQRLYIDSRHALYTDAENAVNRKMVHYKSLRLPYVAVVEPIQVTL